jgi:hypothetical protein
MSQDEFIKYIRIALISIIGIVVLVYTGNEIRKKVWPYTPTPAPSEFFGYIRHLQKNSTTIIIEIDKAEFLYGEEAIIKGMQDSGCTRQQISDCIPSLNNDFYIRNIEKSTVSYAIASSTAIQIMKNPGSPDLSNESLEEFLKDYPNKDLLLDQLIFKFKYEPYLITEMTEQYTP